MSEPFFKKIVKENTIVVSSIEPNTEHKIWIKCGRNQYDKSKALLGRYLTETGTLAYSDNLSLSDFMTVDEGKPYTYQGITDAGNAPYSAWFDKDFKYISSFKQQIGVNTITAPVGACYVRFSVRKDCNDTETFQFEPGTIAHNYEKYIEKEIFIRNDNNNFISFYKEEYDSGWIDLELKDGISVVTADGVTFTPQIRKIGKIVQIRGVVSGISASYTSIAVIPEGFKTLVSKPHLYTSTNYNNGTYINSLYCGGSSLGYQRGGQTGVSGVRTPNEDEKIILDTMYFID